MNTSFIKLSLVAVIAFFSGYFVYPFINSDSEFADAQSSIIAGNGDKQMTESTPEVAAPEVDNHSIPNRAQAKNQAVASDVNTSVDNIAIDETKQKSSVNETDTRVKTGKENISANPELHEEQSNLEQWQQRNKAEVYNRLEELLPDSIKEGFLNNIDRDDFFTDFDATQSAESNEDWSQRMEMEIRDFISLHQSSNVIEMINIECNQLVCRMAGKSTEAHVWQRVFLDLFVKFGKQGDLPNENNKKTGVTYQSDDGNEYFFNQMAFKPRA